MSRARRSGRRFVWFISLSYGGVGGVKVLAGFVVIGEVGEALKPVVPSWSGHT